MRKAYQDRKFRADRNGYYYKPQVLSGCLPGDENAHCTTQPLTRYGQRGQTSRPGRHMTKTRICLIFRRRFRNCSNQTFSDCREFRAMARTELHLAFRLACEPLIITLTSIIKNFTILRWFRLVCRPMEAFLEGVSDTCPILHIPKQY